MMQNKNLENNFMYKKRTWKNEIVHDWLKIK